MLWPFSLLFQNATKKVEEEKEAEKSLLRLNLDKLMPKLVGAGMVDLQILCRYGNDYHLMVENDLTESEVAQIDAALAALGKSRLR